MPSLPALPETPAPVSQQPSSSSLGLFSQVHALRNQVNPGRRNRQDQPQDESAAAPVQASLPVLVTRYEVR